MKRYRLLSFDFDSRAHHLKPAEEQWDDRAKELHEIERVKAINNFKYKFGELNLDVKIANFIDLEFKPLSVLSFHNNFLQQVRYSFVIGSYYPALTGACALGERILNHLILNFRDYHKGSPEYKRVYRKESFDSWPLAIDTLEAWGILLPEPVELFRELNNKRNFAIHFNPETDHNDRELALESIHLLQNIVKGQFIAFGSLPWLFISPGECYIRKDWVDNPYVKHIYIPNSRLVGPKHTIEQVIPDTIVNDEFEYEDKEISDDEFIELRKENRREIAR